MDNRNYDTVDNMTRSIRVPNGRFQSSSGYADGTIQKNGQRNQRHRASWKILMEIVFERYIAVFFLVSEKEIGFLTLLGVVLWFKPTYFMMQ